VVAAGYGEYFTHRTGHSLGQQVHGPGVNCDDFETHDVRRLIPGVAVTVEPGIYLPEFGVRSEINVYVEPGGPRVTTRTQREVTLLG
jgi:Xaa-Pro aminopeptidase